MSNLLIMKRLLGIGLPDEWIVPVMEAIEEPEAPIKKKRRKRRTAVQMAAAKKPVAKKKKKAKKATVTSE